MGSNGVKLLGVSGSLRLESTNVKLLAAASKLSPDTSAFEIYHGIDQLPYFSPDVDPASSEATQDWIDKVRECGGLIVSTPEYARGYPGVLKNALDWLVQTDAFIEKPFMFLHGSNRSSVAKDTLTTVLETMSGVHVDAASLTIHLVGSSLSSEEIGHQYGDEIHQSLNTFCESIASDAH